jgi:hypothetical protein
MVVVTPIIMTVITTLIIAPVIRAVILLIGAGGSTNVFLDLLVGLISICPLLRHHEKVLN